MIVKMFFVVVFSYAKLVKQCENLFSLSYKKTSGFVLLTCFLHLLACLC